MKLYLYKPKDEIVGLVLSVFPGIDLLGMGFREESFCVVCGPDIILGQDIRGWRVPKGVFDGVIGGPPCQSFSQAVIGHEPTLGDLTAEYERIILEAQPSWFLHENVRQAPVPFTKEYISKDFLLNAVDFGVNQSRTRRFTFGTKEGYDIEPFIIKGIRHPDPLPTVTATEFKYGRGDRRRAGRKLGRKLTLTEMKEAFGLSVEWDAPAFLKAEKYRAIGNAVPIPVARAIARAIKAVLY